MFAEPIYSFTGRRKIVDADFYYLKTLSTLIARYSCVITDQGLEYLPNLQQLNKSVNKVIPNEGLHYSEDYSEDCSDFA